MEYRGFLRSFKSRCSFSLPGKQNPEYCVMSVSEGANQTFGSKHQNQPHQIASGSTPFFPPTSQSLAARQQNRTPATNCPFVHSSEQQGIPINYHSHNCSHRPCLPCLPNSGGTVSVSENDSAVQLSADHSNPNPFNELDFQLMNIDPNMSPSSGITSVCLLLPF